MLLFRYIIVKKNTKKQLLIGKNMKKDKANKILGLVTICINALLVFDSLRLYYAYNYTNILFLFMYSNLMLLVNTLFGIIEIYISILLYKNRIGIKLFLIVTLMIWLIIFSNYFFPMY